MCRTPIKKLGGDLSHCFGGERPILLEIGHGESTIDQNSFSMVGWIDPNGNIPLRPKGGGGNTRMLSVFVSRVFGPGRALSLCKLDEISSK